MTRFTTTKTAVLTRGRGRLEEMREEKREALGGRKREGFRGERGVRRKEERKRERREEEGSKTAEDKRRTLIRASLFL